MRIQTLLVPCGSLQVRMKELCQWLRENYFLWWKKTKEMVGPECGGTWKRRDMSPHPTSKSSWTVVPKVPWPTYDLSMTFTWPLHDLHIISVWPTNDLSMTNTWPLYDPHVTSVWPTCDLWLTYTYLLTLNDLCVTLSDLLFLLYTPHVTPPHQLTLCVTFDPWMLTRWLLWLQQSVWFCALPVCVLNTCVAHLYTCESGVSLWPPYTHTSTEFWWCVQVLLIRHMISLKVIQENWSTVRSVSERQTDRSDRQRETERDRDRLSETETDWERHANIFKPTWTFAVL